MSDSRPPYYYRDGAAIFHWHKSCSQNCYPAPGWHQSIQYPGGREQCEECKRK